MSLRDFVIQTVPIFAIMVFMLLASPVLAALAPQTAATLTLPSVVIPPGADTTLAVTLRQNPGGVRAALLTLTYDPAVADLLAVTADWAMAFNEQPSGVITIALATTIPPAGDVTLARLTFRAVGVKGQNTAVTFQRVQLNEDQGSVTTQAGQIAVDTPPVTDARAGRTGGGVQLQWSGVGSDAQHYEVWRGDNTPYFTPGAGGTRIADNLSPGTLSWTDASGGLGSATTNSFYIILAVDASGRASPVSNRVGKFDFGLQSGVAP